jgi:hypothetical protein
MVRKWSTVPISLSYTTQQRGGSVMFTWRTLTSAAVSGERSGSCTWIGMSDFAATDFPLPI